MIKGFPENKQKPAPAFTAQNAAAVSDIMKAINGCNRILISAHVRLDGDAIGSEIAMYNVLKNLGKEPTVSNDSLIPRAYAFLPETASFDTPADLTNILNGKYELIIILDSPSPKRIGKVYSILSTGVPVINIDHHVSNSNYGNINLVCTDFSSTGEIILRLLKETSQKITPEIATALYVAIITDTGRFTHANTTSESLRDAAYLIDHGANPAEIAKCIYKTNTYGQVMLHASATKTMRLDAGGRIAIVHLTHEMMETTHTSAIDTQEFSDIPASIEGVKVGILLREMKEPGMVKVSLRSGDSVDVNKIAQKFGGGGHERAAGCEICGSITDVEKIMVEETKKLI
jgi:phosphoesterase RecJ-like protein